jgi:hypothetical protein
MFCKKQLNINHLFGYNIHRDKKFVTRTIKEGGG